MLQVTNKNLFELKDRFDGRDYTFPVGATVALGEDAARHIFGFGEADKVPFLTRQGWVHSTGDIDAGMEKLNGFSFSSMDSPLPGEIIRPDDEEELLPAEQPALKGGKRSVLDKLSANA